MNYSIIKDEKLFNEFIQWLPDLEQGEQFYYSLFARKKYDTTGILTSDKSQIARGVSTKDRLYDKIRKLEVPVGTYKIGNQTVPENTLALYILPNPRSMKKASIQTVKEILNNIEKEVYQNPKSVALNAIQISKSRTVWVDFDFDINNKDYDKHMKDIAYEATGNTECFKTLKTRGGYHILVDPSLTTEKRWYQNLSGNKSIDQKGDLLLPVAGCCQGDYIPNFI